MLDKLGCKQSWMAINAEGWLIHSPELFLGQGRSRTFVFERVGFYYYIIWMQFMTQWIQTIIFSRY